MSGLHASFLWMLSLLKSPFFSCFQHFSCATSFTAKKSSTVWQLEKNKVTFIKRGLTIITTASMRLLDKVFPFFICGCFQNCPATSLTGFFLYKHGASIFKWEELGVQWSEKATISRTSGTGSSCLRTGSKIHVAVCSSGAPLCTENNLKLTFDH